MASMKYLLSEIEERVNKAKQAYNVYESIHNDVWSYARGNHELLSYINIAAKEAKIMCQHEVAMLDIALSYFSDEEDSTVLKIQALDKSFAVRTSPAQIEALEEYGIEIQVYGDRIELW